MKDPRHPSRVTFVTLSGSVPKSAKVFHQRVVPPGKGAVVNRAEYTREGPVGRNLEDRVGRLDGRIVSRTGKNRVVSRIRLQNILGKADHCGIRRERDSGI